MGPNCSQRLSADNKRCHHVYDQSVGPDQLAPDEASWLLMKPADLDLHGFQKNTILAKSYIRSALIMSKAVLSVQVTLTVRF